MKRLLLLLLLPALAQADPCGSDLTTSLIVFHFNQWTYPPADSDCLSASTDIYSTTTGFFYTFNFAAITATNIPSPADFQLIGSAGQAGASLADYTASGYISSGTQWDWVLAQRVSLPACNTTGVQVPKATWVKDDAFDYCGNDRINDIGALNHR